MEQVKVSGDTDTIVAVSTPAGVGGIAVIRISGPCAFEIVGAAWQGKNLSDTPSHTAHLGKYISVGGNLIDEAVATTFKAPRSFTGEDVIELSVHGSKWIQREILNDLVKRGARIASPGEFTQRAFLNGKIDLAQAEGVADLISSSSRASHRLAIQQAKGVFSSRLDSLRAQLIEFASLLELELDFSEEDVEFADRSHLLSLARDVLASVERLSRSYSAGAVLKDGVPVVIAGVPNAGKSSLLNLLLDYDKAIVSNIPGTTRDVIEETMEINGILFRFIDTAGLRETTDIVENLGIDRTVNSIRKAAIILWVVDITADIKNQIDELKKILASLNKEEKVQKIIILRNKSDLKEMNPTTLFSDNEDTVIDFSTKTKETLSTQHNLKFSNPGIREINFSAKTGEFLSTQHDLKFSYQDVREIDFSAKTGKGLLILQDTLTEMAMQGNDMETDIIVTNGRHYEALLHGSEALRRAISGLETGLSADFIAQDIREATHHLGSITGTVTTTDLLHSIFSHFCIGK